MRWGVIRRGRYETTADEEESENKSLRSLEAGNSTADAAGRKGSTRSCFDFDTLIRWLMSVATGGGESSKSGTLMSFYKQHSEQFKALLPYLWPKGKPGLRARLVFALTFLVLSKIASAGSPIATKYAIDSLNSQRWETAKLAVAAYGVLRFASQLFQEMRDNLFQPLSAYTSRCISLLVYDHVQSLSLRFHINRRTGALLTAVNRGSTAYSELLQRLAFSIFPIVLEVTLASAYLFAQYTHAFGLITLGLVIGYFGFTFIATEWRNKFRRQVTSATDDFNQKASDSLTNFETIKYFSAEHFMSREYDSALARYQNAQIQNQQSLLALNTGQSLIIGACIIGALLLSVERIQKEKMSIGDFALVQGAYIV